MGRKAIPFFELVKIWKSLPKRFNTLTGIPTGGRPRHVVIKALAGYGFIRKIASHWVYVNINGERKPRYINHYVKHDISQIPKNIRGMVKKFARLI